SGYRKSLGETAGELMTTPARTITPIASVVEAARLMDRYGVKRLPVVDEAGRLVGIVSRRDLIKVFLRPDEEIQQRVREALQGKAEVSVSDGVVTLTGTFPERSQAVIAVHLAEKVDGVGAVRDRLSWKHDDVADEPIWGGARGWPAAPRLMGMSSGRILVLNTWSSSIKYELIDPLTKQRSARGLVERIGEEQRRLTHRAGDGQPLVRERRFDGH